MWVFAQECVLSCKVAIVHCMCLEGVLVRLIFFPHCLSDIIICVYVSVLCGNIDMTGFQQTYRKYILPKSGAVDLHTVCPA